METNTTIEERQAKDKQTLTETLKELPIVQIACKKSGISRATYYRWRKEDSNFLSQSENALTQGIDFINDMSESQLITLIKEKKMTAIAMWLKYNNPRYASGSKSQRAVISAQNVNPNDPQQQKLKKVAEVYEEELRKTIIEEINGKQ